MRFTMVNSTVQKAKSSIGYLYPANYLTLNKDAVFHNIFNKYVVHTLGKSGRLFFNIYISTFVDGANKLLEN